MAISLEDAYPQKFLFTGHRGNGKSTELAKLERHLTGSFVVRYALRNVLGLYDVSYVDVLLSLAIQIAEKVQAEEVKLEKPTLGTLERLWSFGKEIERQIESGRAEGGVLGSVLNIGGRISSEATTRQVMREKVTPRISDLFEGLDLLARARRMVTAPSL